MAVYAIGDLQGCLQEFDELLDKVAFGAEDRLWLVGDLINRGPDTLGTLRRVYALREQCEIVLGNHDLHFLAIYFGGHAPRLSDTFDDLLAADDVDELAHWMRCLPLLHRDAELGYLMTHAGLPHIWSADRAEALAAEVAAVLRGENPQLPYSEFFAHMYGNEPSIWRDDLAGLARIKLITNYLTRMRLVRGSGELEFDHKGALSDAPHGWLPWYELVDDEKCREKIIFGHWAALDGHVTNDHVIALDTGCVWGRTLTAVSLGDEQTTSVAARVAPQKVS